MSLPFQLISFNNGLANFLHLMPDRIVTTCMYFIALAATAVIVSDVVLTSHVVCCYLLFALEHWPVTTFKWRHDRLIRTLLSRRTETVRYLTIGLNRDTWALCFEGDAVNAREETKRTGKKTAPKCMDGKCETGKCWKIKFMEHLVCSMLQRACGIRVAFSSDDFCLSRDEERRLP